ncbi:hypothetical protein ACHQM5_006190 [Ranunculus cassubicifolius]
MPPKDTTAADLVRLEKSIADNASGVERLETQSLSVAAELADLKKEFAASIALLHQGMQTLLADRTHNHINQGVSSVPASSTLPDVRTTGIPDPVIVPFLSPRHTDLNSPRQNTTQRPQFQNIPPVPNYKIPKVDFPQFNGSGVRKWLQKAHRFFLVHPVPPDQKVLYASLSLQGKAEAWYVTDAAFFERMPWEEFAYIVNARFSEEICENVVGEFSKLIQTDSVQDYVERFEELRPLMLQRNPGLTKKFFVDSFLSGLKAEVKHSVQMFCPTSMIAVVQLARLQEANIESVAKSNRTSRFKSVSLPNSYAGKYSNVASKPNGHKEFISTIPGHTNSNGHKEFISTIPVHTNSNGHKEFISTIPVHKLSQSEMQARR